MQDVMDYIHSTRTGTDGRRRATLTVIRQGLGAQLWKIVPAKPLKNHRWRLGASAR